MKPSIGRIVHYVLTEADASNANLQRGERLYPQGRLINVGNTVRAGEHVPMIVCVVWPESVPGPNSVNGQVLLDGNDSLWVTSAHEGTEPGTWHWPERVE